jgi:excisionase family DNA binding protein
MGDSPEHLTINEAAEYLGVSRHKIRRLIKSARLHCYEDWQDSRRRLIRIAELDQLREQVSQACATPLLGTASQRPNP